MLSIFWVYCEIEFGCLVLCGVSWCVTVVLRVVVCCVVLWNMPAVFSETSGIYVAAVGFSSSSGLWVM